jgi:hypothetical protein
MIKDSLRTTPRWKPNSMKTTNEKEGPFPSYEQMHNMESDELIKLRLHRIRYNTDGNKLFNLQYEMSDGSKCPPDEVYANIEQVQEIVTFPAYSSIGKISVGVHHHGEFNNQMYLRRLTIEDRNGIQLFNFVGQENETDAADLNIEKNEHVVGF